MNDLTKRLAEMSRNYSNPMKGLLLESKDQIEELQERVNALKADENTHKAELNKKYAEGYAEGYADAETEISQTYLGKQCEYLSEKLQQRTKQVVEAQANTAKVIEALSGLIAPEDREYAFKRIKDILNRY